jgi:hypothetical protein
MNADLRLVLFVFLDPRQSALIRGEEPVFAVCLSILCLLPSALEKQKSPAKAGDFCEGGARRNTYEK